MEILKLNPMLLGFVKLSIYLLNYYGCTCDLSEYSDFSVIIFNLHLKVNHNIF
jgi:hypothetical protein